MTVLHAYQYFGNVEVLDVHVQEISLALPALLLFPLPLVVCDKSGPLPAHVLPVVEVAVPLVLIEVIQLFPLKLFKQAGEAAALRVEVFGDEFSERLK